MRKNNGIYQGRIGAKVQRVIQEKIRKEMDYTIPVVDLSEVQLDFSEKQLDQKLKKVLMEYKKFTNR
ncbi:hypothetical protein COA26_33915 [Bacillus cereus]|nr:hypothetical protein COA26_33915 [Bacillus cereus]